MDASTRSALQRAKSLIEAHRYEDARALLVTIDDPTADRWLARLNNITAAQPRSVPEQSFTGKLVLSIVLLFVLFIPGMIAVTLFSREAREAQKASGRNLPGANGLILLNRYMFLLLIIFLILAIIFVVYLVNLDSGLGILP